MKLVLAVFILSYLLFTPSSFARGFKIVPKISSGYTVLDDSAREAVKQWKFHPAHYENVPYAVLVLIPIQFVLSE